MAHKLKFQNSLDTGGTKPSRTTAKQKTKEPDKTAATTSGPTLVKEGQFRDKKAAQAKVAALQKQGEKASLKEGKDQQGTYYTVYRQGSEAAKAAGQTAAKNQEKSAGTANKSSQAPERQVKKSRQAPLDQPQRHVEGLLRYGSISKGTQTP